MFKKIMFSSLFHQTLATPTGLFHTLFSQVGRVSHGNAGGGGGLAAYLKSDAAINAPLPVCTRAEWHALVRERFNPLASDADLHTATALLQVAGKVRVVQ